MHTQEYEDLKTSNSFFVVEIMEKKNNILKLLNETIQMQVGKKLLK